MRAIITLTTVAAITLTSEQSEVQTLVRHSAINSNDETHCCIC